jgi:hypothetical protein
MKAIHGLLHPDRASYRYEVRMVCT